MRSTAPFSCGKNGPYSKTSEFSELIRSYNQKLIKEKFERYQIKSSDLNQSNFTEDAQEAHLKIKQGDELLDETNKDRDAMSLVENAYKKNLLKIFRGKKTFLIEGNLK